jgi:hypothetical protein
MTVEQGSSPGSTDASAVPLDIAETLRGKNILLIGSTGFVGKVAISMLLDRYPEVGKIIALVRPGMGNTAEDRFFKKVSTSPAFDPLRERYGSGFDAYLHDKVFPVGGDIGRPLCNFGDEDLAASMSSSTRRAWFRLRPRWRARFASMREVLATAWISPARLALPWSTSRPAMWLGAGKAMCGKTKTSSAISQGAMI